VAVRNRRLTPPTREGVDFIFESGKITIAVVLFGPVGIALSAALAGAAEAQETKKNPHVAPAAVYEVAPGLGHFTDDTLFGEVWLPPNVKHWHGATTESPMTRILRSPKPWVAVPSPGWNLFRRIPIPVAPSQYRVGLTFELYTSVSAPSIGATKRDSRVVLRNGKQFHELVYPVCVDKQTCP
jgi:hypothetical protein